MINRTKNLPVRRPLKVDFSNLNSLFPDLAPKMRAYYNEARRALLAAESVDDALLVTFPELADLDDTDWYDFSMELEYLASNSITNTPSDQPDDWDELSGDRVSRYRSIRSRQSLRRPSRARKASESPELYGWALVPMSQSSSYSSRSTWVHSDYQGAVLTWDGLMVGRDDFVENDYAYGSYAQPYDIRMPRGMDTDFRNPDGSSGPMPGFRNSPNFQCTTMSEVMGLLDQYYLKSKRIKTTRRAHKFSAKVEFEPRARKIRNIKEYYDEILLPMLPPGENPVDYGWVWNPGQRTRGVGAREDILPYDDPNFVDVSSEGEEWVNPKYIGARLTFSPYAKWKITFPLYNGLSDRNFDNLSEALDYLAEKYLKRVQPQSRKSRMMLKMESVGWEQVGPSTYRKEDIVVQPNNNEYMGGWNIVSSRGYIYGEDDTIGDTGSVLPFDTAEAAMVWAEVHLFGFEEHGGGVPNYWGSPEDVQRDFGSNTMSLRRKSAKASRPTRQTGKSTTGWTSIIVEGYGPKVFFENPLFPDMLIQANPSNGTWHIFKDLHGAHLAMGDTYTSLEQAVIALDNDLYEGEIIERMTAIGEGMLSVKIGRRRSHKDDMGSMDSMMSEGEVGEGQSLDEQFITTATQEWDLSSLTPDQQQLAVDIASVGIDEVLRWQALTMVDVTDLLASLHGMVSNPTPLAPEEPMQPTMSWRKPRPIRARLSKKKNSSKWSPGQDELSQNDLDQIDQAISERLQYFPDEDPEVSADKISGSLASEWQYPDSFSLREVILQKVLRMQRGGAFPMDNMMSLRNPRPIRKALKRPPMRKSARKEILGSDAPPPNLVDQLPPLSMTRTNQLWMLTLRAYDQNTTLDDLLFNIEGLGRSTDDDLAAVELMWEYVDSNNIDSNTDWAYMANSPVGDEWRSAPKLKNTIRARLAQRSMGGMVNPADKEKERMARESNMRSVRLQQSKRFTRSRKVDEAPATDAPASTPTPADAPSTDIPATPDGWIESTSTANPGWGNSTTGYTVKKGSNDWWTFVGKDGTESTDEYDNPQEAMIDADKEAAASTTTEPASEEAPAPAPASPPAAEAPPSKAKITKLTNQIKTLRKKRGSK